MSLARLSYLINAHLPAGKWECEAQRQLGSLEAHVVQEVSNALHDVVKQLQGKISSHPGPAVIWVAGWHLEAQNPSPSVYLLASALHDLQGDGKDLVVHSHWPPSTSDLHKEDPEVCSSQIQGKELAFLCGGESGDCIPLICKEQGLTWRLWEEEELQKWSRPRAFSSGAQGYGGHSVVSEHGAGTVHLSEASLFYLVSGKSYTWYLCSRSLWGLNLGQATLTTMDSGRCFHAVHIA